MKKLDLFINELKLLREKSQHIEVETWKSDIRKLVKIYKDIDSLEKFIEARSIFKTFSDNFEKWVYKYLLKDDKETPRQKQIRSLGWNAFLFIVSQETFPTSYNWKTEKHEPDVDELIKKRQKIITKWNNKFRVFFKDVVHYYDEEFSPYELDKKEIINKFGINFVIYPSMKTEDRMEKVENYFKTQLPKEVNLLKKKGFNKLFDNLNIEIIYSGEDVDYGNLDGLTGGLYYKEKDKMIITFFGLFSGDEVLTHELGHRLYFKLGNKAKQTWEKEINNLTDEITREDFSLFYDKYISSLEYEITNEGENNIKHIKIKEKDEILKNKFEFIKKTTERIRFYTWGGMGYNIKRKLGKFVIGKKIHLGFNISEYATTNAWEGFAEAFKLYINKPNKLNMFIKTILFNTLRAGSYKINENINKENEFFLN